MKLESMLRVMAMMMMAGSVGACAVDDGGDDDADGEETETSAEALTAKTCANAPDSAQFPFAPDQAITIRKVSNMTCRAAADVWRAKGSLASKGWTCRRVSGSDLSNTNRCTKGDRRFWYAFAE